MDEVKLHYSLVITAIF